MKRLHCSIPPRPHLQTARVGDIARPNDPFDQYPPRILPLCRCPHDPRDLDATSQKRGLGRSLWRRGHGEYFRGADDQCVDEDHGLAGGYLLSPHLRPLDSLRAEGQYQERTWKRAEERPSTRSASFTDSQSKSCRRGRRFTDSQSKSCHRGRRFTHPRSIRVGSWVARNGH